MVLFGSGEGCFEIANVFGGKPVRLCRFSKCGLEGRESGVDSLDLILEACKTLGNSVGKASRESGNVFEVSSQRCRERRFLSRRWSVAVT